MSKTDSAESRLISKMIVDYMTQLKKQVPTIDVAKLEADYKAS